MADTLVDYIHGLDRTDFERLITDLTNGVEDMQRRFGLEIKGLLDRSCAEEYSVGKHITFERTEQGLSRELIIMNHGIFLQLGKPDTEKFIYIQLCSFEPGDLRRRHAAVGKILEFIKPKGEKPETQPL